LIITAKDAQPVQVVLRRRRQTFDLADVGHYAGEHQNLPNPIPATIMPGHSRSMNGDLKG
jgi:hypothetical protein